MTPTYLAGKIIDFYGKKNYIRLIQNFQNIFLKTLTKISNVCARANIDYPAGILF